MKLTLTQIKTLFENDTKTRKANKSANAVVIALCDLVAQTNANLVIDCDLSKGGNIPSRGIVAENLVKVWFKNSQQKSSKYSLRGYDFHHNGVGYEVKCSTSKGYAHYNPKQDLTNLIFVNQSGIYLTSGENIILDNCHKHIKDIIFNKNVKVLHTF